MNFKKYFKETADPEKIKPNINCSFCGKKLDHKDLEHRQHMNQDTGSLCLNCQKLLDKKISDNNNKNYDPSIKLSVWGNRQQMF